MSVHPRFLSAPALALCLLLVSCNRDDLTGVATPPDLDSFSLKTALLPAGVKLTWQGTKSPVFQEYLVFRAEAGVADYRQLAALPDTVWTDQTAAGGKVYYFLVAAMAQDGSEIARSNVVAALVPPAAEFQLEGGAAYTARDRVGLTLAADDCASVLIWNGAAADSATGQAFACADGRLQVAAWALAPGEGLRTVHARLRYETPDPDHAGQVLQSTVDVRRDIVLDQTPPNILPGLIAPAEGAVAPGYKIALEWSRGSDQLCPDLTYQVILGPAGATGQLEYSGATAACLVSGLVCGTTYSWQVTVRDAAGNEATAPVWSFTADDDLVRVDPGTFAMGSPYGALGRGLDETLHTVTLTRTILVSPHEVTEELWDDVMGAGQSTSRRPRANVTWNQAVLFCNALSEIRGFPPVYTIAGSGQVTWNPAAGGYRLLTEAEWEYACRAGAPTAFASGDISDVACQDPVLDQIGRYCGNNEGRSSEVGSLPANPWGLHDMHGNVWEWCWDYYLGDHQAAAVTDPVVGGYVQDGPVTYRIIRGGNFYNRAENCRSAARTSSAPTQFGYGIGFRFARTVD